MAGLASRFWGRLTVVLLCIFVVWAFPVWTFTFYSTAAVFCSLLALDRLLSWRSTGRARDLFLTGLCIGLAISFKQNYGAFALIGGLAGFLVVRMEARSEARAWQRGFAHELGIFAAGGFAVGAPLMLYFAVHGALDDMFQSLVVHPFVFAGQHSVPYLSPGALFRSDVLSNVERLTYGAYSLYNTAIPTEWLRSSRLIERLHVLLYQIPILALAGAAFFSFRSRAPGAARSGL